MQFLGKLPAVPDARVPMLARRMDLGKLPPIPDQVAWHAELPDDGVPILGNADYGCCVEASVCHFLQELGLYLKQPVTPTTDECLAAYSAVTGFNENDPTTDQGTAMLGKGGMVEYWQTHGIKVGGQLNKCGPVAQVNFKNPAELQTAIYLFGFVFMGGQLSQANVDSPFMWLAGSPKIGGHEFLFTGFERTEHAVRYDILTWDGMWRTDDIWVNSSVDEALVVFDAAFFDARKVSPGGIDIASLQEDMKLFDVA